MKPASLLICFWCILVTGCGRQPAAVSTSPAAEVHGDWITPPAGRAGSTSNLQGATADPVTATAAPSAVTPGAPATTEAAPAAPPNSRGPNGAGSDAAYPMVGFDKLAGYAIEITDELLGPVTNDVAVISAKTEALIPNSVKAYGQTRVSLRGFMLPLKVEGGLVTELLIMKDQSMCCYGTVPKIHEWVSVKMTGKGVKPIMDQPVTLQGRLHVGEMRENGYLTGIYRLEGERLIADP